MKKIAYTSLLASQLLAGCVSVYQPPIDGPTATLGITASGGNTMGASIFRDPSNCSGSEMVGLNKSGDSVVTIPAGKMVGFAIRGSGNSSYNGYTANFNMCSIGASFFPDEGKTYIARYLYDTGLGKCGVDIVEVSSSSNERANDKKVKFKIRDYFIPSMASSPACSPI